MKKLFVTLSIGLFSLVNVALAHSPKETYALLEIKNEKLSVTLDLPWSLNNALKENNPHILDDIDEELFIEFAKAYITSNFEVRKGGELVRPTNLEILEGDHFHNARINIEFPCDELQGLSIKNTLLFNINTNQRNYHEVKIGNTRPINYITFQELQSFEIKPKSQTAGVISITIFSAASLALFSLLFIFFRKKKVLFSNPKGNSYSVSLF